jgi:predicted DNA binding CopG/RHH family protein
MKFDDKTKLTSVKILKTNYEDFKEEIANDGMSLQKLVNRALHKYLVDKDFKKLIMETKDLKDQGNNF